MKGKRSLFGRWLSILFCGVTLSLSCSSPVTYENVRLVKERKSFFFSPDRTASREPMTLNIRTSFVSMEGKWGVLFSVPYRETGFGAINRTLFTTVLYAAVVDRDLGQLSGRPQVLYKKEGNITRDFFEAGDSFGVAYLTKENNLICRVFGHKGPLKTIKTFRVPGGHLVKTDMSFTDLALGYYNEEVFLLVHDGTLRVIRAKADGSTEELMAGRDLPDNSCVLSGDLFVDRQGIRLLWAEAPCYGKTPRRASFFYAFRSPAGKSFTIKKLRISGDTINELKAKFIHTGPRLFLLLQYGNMVWEGEAGARPGDLRPVKKLMTLGKRNYPPSTLFSCTSGRCFVFFHKMDGTYHYSRKGGLKKSPSLQYRRAVRCGEKLCIQETNNKGISVFDPEM